MPMVLQIALGILVGVGAGVLHLWMTWWAARRTVQSGQQGLVLSLMPARIVVVAVLIASLALVSVVAVVSGIFGFMVTQRALRDRWPAQEEEGA